MAQWWLRGTDKQFCVEEKKGKPFYTKLSSAESCDMQPDTLQYDGNELMLTYSICLEIAR